MSKGLRMHAGWVSVLMLATLTASACSRSKPFGPAFPDDVRPGFDDALARALEPAERRERPVVVGLSEAPAKLFAWDLQEGLIWEQEVNAQSVPLIAGDYVIMDEAEGVVVRELDTGRVQFRIDEDVSLIGADGVGARAIIALATGEERGLLVGVRDGRVIWERELLNQVGVPALTGDDVVVPWAVQRISILDAGSGRERARAHIPDAVLGHAFVDRGQLFVGQHGLFQVTPDIRRASTGGEHYYRPLGRPLPGQPLLLRDGYEPAPDPDSALLRVRLDWRAHADDGGVIALEHHALYLAFYRLFFALDAEQDRVRWVFQSPHDLVASSVQPDGVLVLSADGQLTFLTPDGQPAWERELGRQVVAARIRVVHPGPDMPSSEAPPGKRAPSLREQLGKAAALDDARLALGRAFAVTHFARFDDARATSRLITWCSDRDAPAPFRVAACESLATRSQGQSHVLAALERRASFLRATPAPPVGALARAAQHMQLRRAASLLTAHVLDPATRAGDLPPLFQALASFEHRPAVGPLERFLRMHHAEPDEPSMVEALRAAAQALKQLGGKRSERVLERLSRDPLATPRVRKELRGVLRASEKPPVQPETTEPKPAPKPAVDKRPVYLSSDLVKKALRPVRRPLRRCLARDPADPHRARVSMVVEGDGRIASLFVAPTSLQECIGKVLDKRRFPATRKGRQQISHVIRRR